MTGPGRPRVFCSPSCQRSAECARRREERRGARERYWAQFAGLFGDRGDTDTR
jgi:hypothetical protein